MTSTYWEKHNLRDLCPGWANLLYALPPGCELLPVDISGSLDTKHNLNQSFVFPRETRDAQNIPRIDVHYGNHEVDSYWNKTCGTNHVSVYQKCNNSTRQWMFGDISGPWTYLEWLITDRPHALGLMDGIAYPTGVALISVITIMIICSLPFIRQGGHFEVICIIKVV